MSNKEQEADISFHTLNDSLEKLQQMKTEDEALQICKYSAQEQSDENTNSHNDDNNADNQNDDDQEREEDEENEEVEESHKDQGNTTTK